MDGDAVSDTQASWPPMPRHLVDLEDGGAVRHLTENRPPRTWLQLTDAGTRQPVYVTTEGLTVIGTSMRWHLGAVWRTYRSAAWSGVPPGRRHGPASRPDGGR